MATKFASGGFFLSLLLNLISLYGAAAEEGFAVAALEAVIIPDSIRLRLINEILFSLDTYLNLVKFLGETNQKWLHAIYRYPNFIS